MEYYSAIKRNKILIHVNRRQTQKATYDSIYMKYPEIHRDKK